MRGVVFFSEREFLSRLCCGRRLFLRLHPRKHITWVVIVEAKKHTAFWPETRSGPDGGAGRRAASAGHLAASPTATTIADLQASAFDHCLASLPARNLATAAAVCQAWRAQVRAHPAWLGLNAALWRRPARPRAQVWQAAFGARQAQGRAWSAAGSRIACWGTWAA